MGAYHSLPLLWGHVSKRPQSQSREPFSRRVRVRSRSSAGRGDGTADLCGQLDALRLAFPNQAAFTVSEAAATTKSHNVAMGLSSR